MLSKEDVIFKKGDLPNRVLWRSTIPLFSESNYRLSIIWHYKNTSNPYTTIPQTVFLNKIDEKSFLDFMDVALNIKQIHHFDAIERYNLLEIMYLLKYNNKKDIWAKMLSEYYTIDLAMMTKKYDKSKAIEIADIIDWGRPVEKNFLIEFDKDDLIEIIFKMSGAKKRRRLLDSSASPC